MTDSLTDLYSRRAVLRDALDRATDRKAELDNERDALARKIDDLNYEIAAAHSGRSAKAEKHRPVKVNKTVKMTLD